MRPFNFNVAGLTINNGSKEYFTTTEFNMEEVFGVIIL